MLSTLPTIVIMIGYLLVTALLGLWQSRRVKESKDFTKSSLSIWQAATFLAGFTMGGGATYGVAGDTIKFGLTYLFWFPISIALGWWVTGLLFSKPYFQLKGMTIPSFLKDRFEERTRVVASISTMIYAIFILLLELYTLAIIIRSLAPTMPMAVATLIALLISMASVAFSGILGASYTNLMHYGVILAAFSISLVVLWHAVGGWSNAIQQFTQILPDVSSPGVSSTAWLSIGGLGWGVTGQLLLGKAGRLGGVSVVSNLAASCRSEKDATKAFWLSGLLSCIPPLLSSALGIFTAVFLGGHLSNLPVYSALGLAVGKINPYLAGFLLAAIAAAILSTIGPDAIVLSSVFVEDIVKPIFPLSEKTKKFLYPGSVIVISILCAVYVTFVGIKDILPFLYTTAFPTTAPLTIVVLFGIYSKRIDKRSAFWAITLGVPIALIWGIILKDPWGIPNIYLAYLVPLIVLGAGFIRSKKRINVEEVVSN